MRVAMFGLASLTLGLGGIVALADAPSRGDDVRDGARSHQPAATAAPVVLRHTTFNIPFTINAGGPVPAEIQLYLSTDRGATWKLCDRAPPQSGHFAFRAKGDGEYWFALKTILRRGHSVSPDEKFETGLRVFVDSTEPHLDFQAQIGAAGEVITSWQASDSTLDAASFKVEYQTDEGGPWRQVAVDKQTVETASDEFSGQMQWWPETASRALNIRAEVSDRAMNKTVINRRVVLPRVATHRAGEEALNSTEAGEVPPDPYVSVPESTSGAIPWLPNEQTPSSAGAASVPPGDDLVTRANKFPRYESVSQQNQRRETKRPANILPDQETAGKKKIDNPFFPPGSELADLGQFPPIESEVRPPVGGVTGPAEPSRGSQAPPDPYTQQTSLPAGERPRMTAARQFQLEYDVDSVGPAGIAEVQLWGTRDGGRFWKLWSTDDDRRSPLDVSVPAEGVYGFRVVVVGNNGLAGKKPSAGDLADLWIGIDTTVPTVRLTSAIYGEGRFAGQLDIRWTAKDESFSDRPITLKFSEQAEGPWSTIASGIPNSGQYHWSVEPRIPQKIFLRIEARDQAGNVGDHQLRQSVSTTGLIPQGHIRGFRPLTTPSGAASRW